MEIRSRFEVESATRSSSLIKSLRAHCRRSRSAQAITFTAKRFVIFPFWRRHTSMPRSATHPIIIANNRSCWQSSFSGDRCAQRIVAPDAIGSYETGKMIYAFAECRLILITLSATLRLMVERYRISSLTLSIASRWTFAIRSNPQRDSNHPNRITAVAASINFFSNGFRSLAERIMSTSSRAPRNETRNKTIHNKTKIN